MNRYYPHTIIAQEGWSFIIGGLVASVFFSFLWGWWSLPFWVFTLFCLNFFRDPARNIPEAPDAVISPADGRVMVVERTFDPYRNTDALKISVFMNVFNVHSQRSPVSGIVSDVKYTAGKFLNASLDKSSNENERNAVLMTTRTGREITFVQVAGLVARRVLCYVNKGDSMVRGERYGFIRFGSRVDVYLPLDATANVAIGDKVRASETILAYLPLEPSEVIGDLRSPNSRTIAENRLKSDVQATSVSERLQGQGILQPAPLSLDEARLAAETAHLKAEAEAAKQAAEQTKIQAEAEIARLKAEAEQARIAIEQAKAQAEAEVARLKAEQEAVIQAQTAQVQAEQEAKVQAEAQARAQAEAHAKAQAEQVAKAQAEAQAARAQAQQEAQARAQAEAEAKAQAEQAAKAQAEAEAIRLKAEQEAQARVQAEAKQKAEQEAKEQAAKAKAHAEEVAKAQAAAKAKEEALAKAKAEAEAKQKAEQAAKAKATQEAKARSQAEQSAKAKAEAEALAEIAARKPIVRREVFAAVPEPWQTIEPREVIIRTEVVDGDKK